MIANKLEETSAQTRRERVRQMMRQDILDAARQIIHEDGYKKLSMRALARAVGVTAPTLYDYFPSKEAVLEGLQIEGAELFAKYLQEAVETNEPGRAQLRALGNAYRNFARDHRDLFHLVVGRLDAAYELNEAERMRCTALLDVVIDVVRDAMDRGVLRAGDPVALAIAMWAMTHGCVELELNGVLNCLDGQDPAMIFMNNLEILFEGLRSA